MLQSLFLRRFAGRLALLAVWLQLALSFGHIHPWDIFPFGHPVVQGVGSSQVVADHRGPLAPWSDSAAADQACAICANMAMAGSLVLPDPVKLPLPVYAVGQAVEFGSALALTSPAFLLFQTRAPPSV